MADLEKFGGGKCRYVLTKRAQSVRRRAKCRSFEGVPGVSSPENFLKVTLKSMHFEKDFSRFFLFIIALILLVY